MTNSTRLLHSLRVLLVVFALALLVVWQRAIRSGFIPPPEVQGQSFSIASGNPLSNTGVHPADILGVGGYPLVPCENLGLLCNDPVTGAPDDIAGLSFGYDFVAIDLPPLQFSVAGGSQGASGTAVRVEANCSPAEPRADVFETPADGSNYQDLDGDGDACGSNSGFGLSLTEGATSDNVDALDRDPCQFADFNCDGVPDDPVFLTLTPGSPTLGLLGATSADILIAAADYVPVVWAGSNSLGLLAGDRIDALCVRDNGNGIYDGGDRVWFSLAPGSPTLAALPATPADVLGAAPLRLVYPAGQLGLLATDNVDALMCAMEIQELFLPVIRKS
ncbi:MAG: hypothetical protein L0332_28065 [Chloroflexi bacterium]|nr:hypothetical protein [Chloroflexota bacterium]MCI0574779.1 hypothetical protein [Chloroflexota bacterium]MCI0648854.1 hypothetical protein [Chloroflexota bacterium]MCI0730556.1 hypothetical protein [Chloroflexota bacterium]